METLRVLQLLNVKASKELQSALLEEAADTATQAVNHYLTTYHVTNETQSSRGNVLVQCQAQLSALLLRKIGIQYRSLGEKREDTSLVETGKALIVRSSQILKLCRSIHADPTQPSPKRKPNLNTPASKRTSPPKPPPRLVPSPSPCRVSSTDASVPPIEPSAKVVPPPPACQIPYRLTPRELSSRSTKRYE